MEGLKEELAHHTLRSTASRLAVLAVFKNNKFALSHTEIEKELGKDYDRVTIYRTLTSFLDKGLIHKVLDDSGVSKYALCQHDCSTDSHQDNHVHFKCSICGSSECLTELSIPNMILPEGYVLEHSNLLMEGTCNSCS